MLGYKTMSRKMCMCMVYLDSSYCSTPFRSEAMIGALEAAIAHYQKIVAAGGWQQIPGQRMIGPATTTRECRWCAVACVPPAI